jgi:hypothetical protein
MERVLIVGAAVCSILAFVLEVLRYILTARKAKDKKKR